MQQLSSNQKLESSCLWKTSHPSQGLEPWNFHSVVVASLVSESSPHLFPAPSIRVPPNVGWCQQCPHPLLSKKTLDAGAAEYNGSLCPKLGPPTRHLYGIPLWEPQGHGGPPASLPCSIQGKEHSSGQESALPAAAWSRLQHPPRALTSKALWLFDPQRIQGPGNGLLKAESFPGFRKDACP